MRTRQAAAWTAAALLAGGTLLSGAQPALANRLKYVEPTEYEVEHPEVGSRQPEAAAPEAEEEEAPEAPAYVIDSSLAQAMAAIRMCESGGDYGANTGNGYYGAYQFALSTWSWLGYGGYPHLAAPSVQDEAAVALYNIYGWSPWPACSRYLGLR